MNKRHILFHLKEALEELERTIKDLEQDPVYEYGEYLVAMSHLYHHINTAWNARDASDERAELASEDDFNRWRKFPSEAELLLDD